MRAFMEKRPRLRLLGGRLPPMPPSPPPMPPELPPIGRAPREPVGRELEGREPEDWEPEGRKPGELEESFMTYSI